MSSAITVAMSEEDRHRYVESIWIASGNREQSCPVSTLNVDEKKEDILIENISKYPL